MKAVQLTSYDGPDALKVVEIPKPTPGPGQVLIRVTSIGVNRAELLMTQGLYPTAPLPLIIGVEAGGYIEELGPGVKSRSAPPDDPRSKGKGRGWDVGDRVSPAHGAFQEKGSGSWAEYVVIDEIDLIPAPMRIADEYIGGLWLPYMTAWHGLHHLAEIDDGMRIVLPAASSSVGLAAIEVCQYIGASTIATTRTRDKVAEIVEATGLDEKRIIVTDEETLAEGVERILGHGARIDAFFDPIGGDFIDEELQCLRKGGTIVLYGALGGEGRLPTGRIVMKEARILGYHLGMLRRDLELHNPDNSYNVLLRRFDQGDLVPKAAATFPLELAADALRTLALNEHTGKIYLIP